MDACFVCTKSSAFYQCPKCGRSFCSVDCFKGDAHSQCAGMFYRDCVQERCAESAKDHETKNPIIEKVQKLMQESLVDASRVEIDPLAFLGLSQVDSPTCGAASGSDDEEDQEECMGELEDLMKRAELLANEGTQDSEYLKFDIPAASTDRDQNSNHNASSDDQSTSGSQLPVAESKQGVKSVKNRMQPNASCSPDIEAKAAPDDDLSDNRQIEVDDDDEIDLENLYDYGLDPDMVASAVESLDFGKIDEAQLDCLLQKMGVNSKSNKLLLDQLDKEQADKLTEMIHSSEIEVTYDIPTSQSPSELQSPSSSYGGQSGPWYRLVKGPVIDIEKVISALPLPLADIEATTRFDKIPLPANVNGKVVVSNLSNVVAAYVVTLVDCSVAPPKAPIEKLQQLINLSRTLTDRFAALDSPAVGVALVFEAAQLIGYCKLRYIEDILILCQQSVDGRRLVLVMLLDLLSWTDCVLGQLGNAAAGQELSIDGIVLDFVGCKLLAKRLKLVTKKLEFFGAWLTANHKSVGKFLRLVEKDLLLERSLILHDCDKLH